VARHAKRRLENPLTKAQKSGKAVAKADRLRKVQRTADRNSETLIAMPERRSVAGAEGLAAEAFRKSTRRKSHPLIVDQKAEKVRVETERGNVAGAEFLAAEATRLSGRRKTNLSTVEHTAKTYVADAVRYRPSRLIVDEQKAKKIVLRPKDGIPKVHKL